MRMMSTKKKTLHLATNFFKLQHFDRQKKKKFNNECSIDGNDDDDNEWMNERMNDYYLRIQMKKIFSCFVSLHNFFFFFRGYIHYKMHLLFFRVLFIFSIGANFLLLLFCYQTQTNFNVERAAKCQIFVSR